RILRAIVEGVHLAVRAVEADRTGHRDPGGVDRLATADRAHLTRIRVHAPQAALDLRTAARDEHAASGDVVDARLARDGNVQNALAPGGRVDQHDLVRAVRPHR